MGCGSTYPYVRCFANMSRNDFGIARQVLHIAGAFPLRAIFVQIFPHAHTATDAPMEEPGGNRLACRFFGKTDLNVVIRGDPV